VGNFIYESASPIYKNSTAFASALNAFLLSNQRANWGLIADESVAEDTAGFKRYLEKEPVFKKFIHNSTLSDYILLSF